MGRRYLNLFGNRLHFWEELCLSLWRVSKTLIMNQRCSLGQLSSVVIKHRLCKKTVTYAVDLISHVWKTSLSSPSCWCEPVRVGRSRTGICPSLTWNHLWGDSWGLKLSQSPPQSSFSLSELGKPFIASSLPGCCHSSWPKKKSRARLGFSVDFIDIFPYGFFFFNGPYSKGLIVWVVSFPIF